MRLRKQPKAAKAPYRKIGSLLSPVQQTRLRTLQGPLSRADIAMLVGVSPATITYVFNGHKLPGIQLLGKLARVLHVTVDDLVETLDREHQSIMGGGDNAARR